ncbi:MAG: hydrogenase nickel incorporation protein HypB [Cyclobacteriaceae bacterium]|jgi:hydrogenase nickel incorporation protein HypB|nr:hydrogenase accessory protein HypB [Cytophagales bacterium]HNP76102.1 hydrogenase nickel incorporation protein HypB [Cyclobacteriaceae bacterium]
MCATCGCDHESSVLIRKVEAAKTLDLQGLQLTKLPTAAEPPRRIQLDLEQDILLKNNLKAERNRGYFMAKDILALNLVSSPGSGKTSLLERTLSDLNGDLTFSVIEGDQQTTNDADRIAATGAPVVQINTGKGCHLDADMIENAIQKLGPENNSVVIIENIGNLVCPAMFDLGEQSRVVIISVTEGDDKPLKYPDMFQSSDLCIINKIDLLPYVNFDCELAKTYARQVNPKLEFIELSATRGQGLEDWYHWLKSRVHEPAVLK